MPIKRHYIPPSAQHIDTYAKRICQAMDEEVQPEVMHGLAQFLKHLMHLHASLLNKSDDAPFDNDSQSK